MPRGARRRTSTSMRCTRSRAVICSACCRASCAMFEWGWPWLFLLLPLPWLVLRWWPAADEQGAALHLPYDDVLDPAEVAGGARRVFTGLGLAWLIWALLITAVARPQWVGEP